MNTSKGSSNFKLLLIWACPEGMAHLKIQEEERVIRESMSQGDFRDAIEIDTLPSCRIGDLHKILMRKQYHLIHFSGHSDRAFRLHFEVTSKQYRKHQLSPPPQGFKYPEAFAAAVSRIVDDMEKYAASFTKSFQVEHQATPGSLSVSSTSSTGSCLSFSPATRPPSGSIESFPGMDLASRTGLSTPMHTCSSSSLVSSVDTPNTDMSTSTSSSLLHVPIAAAYPFPPPLPDRRLPVPSFSGFHGLGPAFQSPDLVSQSPQFSIRIPEALGSELDTSLGIFTPDPDYGPVMAYSEDAAEERSPEQLFNDMIAAEKLAWFKLNYSNLPLTSVASYQSAATVETTVDVNDSFSYYDLINIGVGSLCFHGEGTNACARVNVIDLAKALLGQRELQCVVLNACSSVIAGHVTRHLVPYTLCMTGKMTDAESLSFSKAFYSALAAGHSFEEAFSQSKGFMELNSSIPGTPRRPRDSHDSSIVHLFSNGFLTRMRKGSSIRVIVGDTFARKLFDDKCSDNRLSDSNSATASQSSRISALEAEITRLRAENAALQKDKAHLSSIISTGQEHLLSMTKEMSVMREMIGGLTAANLVMSGKPSKKLIHVTASASSALPATAAQSRVVGKSSAMHSATVVRPAIRPIGKFKASATASPVQTTAQLPVPKATAVVASAVPVVEAVSVSSLIAAVPSPTTKHTQLTRSLSTDGKTIAVSAESKSVHSKKKLPVVHAASSAVAAPMRSLSPTVHKSPTPRIPVTSLSMDSHAAVNRRYLRQKSEDSASSSDDFGSQTLSSLVDLGELQDTLDAACEAVEALVQGTVAAGLPVGIAAVEGASQESGEKEHQSDSHDANQASCAVAEDLNELSTPPVRRLRRIENVDGAHGTLQHMPVAEQTPSTDNNNINGANQEPQITAAIRTPPTRKAVAEADQCVGKASTQPVRENKKKSLLLTYSPPKPRPNKSGQKNAVNPVPSASSALTAGPTAVVGTTSAPASLSGQSLFGANSINERSMTPSDAYKEYLNRRRVNAKAKQSSSFASVVPRFDSLAAVAKAEGRASIENIVKQEN